VFVSSARASSKNDRVEKGWPVGAVERAFSPRRRHSVGANAGWKRLLKKSRKGKLSRRSTLMNADKAIVFNLRSSVFIGGQL
jgi:hypothetical protein